jgi:hypothetical protein
MLWSADKQQGVSPAHARVDVRSEEDDLTNQYNAALADAMRPYANLHLVDFHSQAEGALGFTCVH